MPSTAKLRKRSSQNINIRQQQSPDPSSQSNSQSQSQSPSPNPSSPSSPALSPKLSNASLTGSIGKGKKKKKRSSILLDNVVNDTANQLLLNGDHRRLDISEEEENSGVGKTDRGTVKAVKRKSSSSMYKRDVGLGEDGIRMKNVRDEREWLEMGGSVEDWAAREGAKDGSKGHGGTKSHLTPRDKRAMVLLVALYLLQGIPVGLAFGSIPYLLRSKLSYSQIGLFTLSTYPYSLKLLWSPIVDAVYFQNVGRRKSWIIPVQTIVGIMLWWLGNNVSALMDKEIPDVHTLTLLFFTLVFFAATQDIAVDGWALELLSKENLSYASTAQTIGLNTGYFLSFTVFLAFNSIEFSNKYFRTVPLEYPLVSLSGYLKFWGAAYVLVTGYLAFFQKEDPVVATDDSDMGIRKVYSIMYNICKLKHIQSFVLVHLLAKLGTAANDAATSLKLLEKGLSKEDLALAVLIDFPFQIIFGYLAARWSRGDKPLRPWLTAMWARLGFAVVSMGLIGFFPPTPISTSFFLLVICCTVLSSFASTVQFVGISAFHTQIADPVIGGTYMTLLNTVSNLGGTWPRYFILQGVDSFTVAHCKVKDEAGGAVLVSGAECVSDHGKAACSELGGECVTERDGYFVVSSVCIFLGTLILLFFAGPTAKKLQSLPSMAWRVKSTGGVGGERRA